MLLLNSDPMGTDVQYLGKLTLFGATGNNGCSLLVKVAARPSTSAIPPTNVHF